MLSATFNRPTPLKTTTTSIKPNPKPHKNIRNVTPKRPKAPFVRASRRGVTLEAEISAKFVATWPSGRLLFLNVHLDTGYFEQSSCTPKELIVGEKWS